MAYSSVSYSANSSANSGKDYTYSFPAIAHDTANILVLVGGAALAITRYTVASSGGTITLEDAPGGAGAAPLDAVLSASNVLKIYRFTNRTSPEVVFSSTSIIQDEDLNNATDQVRYLALEAVDRANEGMTIDESDASRYNVQIDGVDKRIFGVATPTNDKDAANKAYTDTNVSLAAGSATEAAGSAGDAEDSAEEAEEWATKVDGYVSGSGNSAQAWAVGGTFVTDTASRGAAKEWAVGSGRIDDPTTGEYSSKEYATGTTAESAKSWATKTGGDVPGGSSGDKSAKSWASETGVSAPVDGSAKEWAVTAEDSVVADSEYSAKHYAAKASDSLSTFQGQYVSQATEPSSPDEGALWFNTTANNMRVYNGSAFVVLDALPQGLGPTDTPTFATPTADGHAVIKSYADGKAIAMAIVFGS